MRPIRRPAGLAVVLLGLAAAVVPLAGQAPTKLELIPIYPGASRQPSKEAEEGVGAMPSSAVRIYTVKAGLEDVARFYQQRLQARELQTDADQERAAEEEKLAAGQPSPVWFTVEPASLTPAARAVYQRNRTQWRPGEWLLSAGFDWVVKPSADEEVKFTVQLHDMEEFEILDPQYHNETQIEFLVQGSMPAAVATSTRAPQPGPPMAAPRESELGVPLYPGARFDGQVSAGMSQMDNEGTFYVFTSTDSPQQVTAFYQTRTGRKGITNEGGTLIAVKGEGLFPDLGVTIQPNAPELLLGRYPPSVKTVLTIRKRKQK